eukprot:3244541-Amphidinium_carterae.1
METRVNRLVLWDGLGLSEITPCLGTIKTGHASKQAARITMATAAYLQRGKGPVRLKGERITYQGQK